MSVSTASNSNIYKIISDAAGFVGIGTTSPGSQLDVVAQDAFRITGYQPFLTVRDSNSSNRGFRLQTAAGDILFETDASGGGTYAEKMRLSASGNVGIGTTPTYNLDIASASVSGTFIGINNTSATKQYVIGTTGSTNGQGSGKFSIYDQTVGATRLIIDSAGNVGIGTTSPSANLHVTSGGFNVGYFTNGTFASSSNSTLLIGGGDAGLGGWENVFLAIHKWGSTAGVGSSSSLSRIRFDSTGLMLTADNGGSYTLYAGSNGTYAQRVGIGTTTPGYQLTLSTDSAAKPTSNTWTISSDARVKEVIGSYTRGVADIMALEPKRYRLNGAFGSVDDGRVHVSVVAQEAQATWPEMIGTYDHTDKDEDDVETVTELLNLNTNELQWALVNAIKELTTRIATLEQRA